MRSLQTFQKNVTTSGTPVQLNDVEVAAEQSILIKAKAANTGNITVGNSSANALNSSGANFVLDANEAIELDGSNTNEIWIDATVNGEGVEVLIS